MTTTRKSAAKQRRHALLFDLIEHASGRALREALAAYEATGDHDHGRGPIAPGAPCNGYLGDDCWVKRARKILATLEALPDAPLPGAACNVCGGDGGRSYDFAAPVANRFAHIVGASLPRRPRKEQ